MLPPGQSSRVSATTTLDVTRLGRPVHVTVPSASDTFDGTKAALPQLGTGG